MSETEMSVEMPAEDAAEQHRQAVAEPAEPAPAAPKWDADEGDVAESALEVPLDDDEYR